MARDYFTDQEEEIITHVKQLFYYPDQAFSLTRLVGLTKEAATELRAELLRTAIIQLEFEQSQRRDYVAQRITNSKIKLTSEDAANLTRNIAAFKDLDNGLAMALDSINLDPDRLGLDISRIDQAIIDQAQIYKTVAEQLEDFYANALIEQKIKTLFGPLNSLTTEELVTLEKEAKLFIDRVAQLEAKILELNPDIPETIEGLLQKAGLGLASLKNRALNEKLNFLTLAMVIATSLYQNRQRTAPLAEIDLKYALGLWFYYQQTPIDYDELVS